MSVGTVYIRMHTTFELSLNNSSILSHTGWKNRDTHSTQLKPKLKRAREYFLLYVDGVGAPAVE